MYTAFYKLNEKPFRISSDPAFIWLGEKHREALATLKYAILDNKGFMLLTGDVGTGKTTLINALIESLSDDVYYASVPDPRLELADFLNYIGQAFHIDREFKSKGDFLLHFGWFLESAYKQRKKVLLIIDEAQLLTQSLLEEIRLLSNINRDGNHLLNIFLVGQNEFNEIIGRPVNRAVAQRLTLNYQISALSLQETENYIRHRLKIAGGTRMLFNGPAVKEIFAYSGGIPRRINIICDHCLLTGYVEEKETIDATIVRQSTKDIEIPAAVPPPAAERVKEPSEAEKSAARPPAGDKGERRRTSAMWALIMMPVMAVLLVVSGLFIYFFAAPESFMSLYLSGGEFLEKRLAVFTDSEAKRNDVKAVPPPATKTAVIVPETDGRQEPAAAEAASSSPAVSAPEPVRPAPRAEISGKTHEQSVTAVPDGGQFGADQSQQEVERAGPPQRAVTDKETESGSSGTAVPVAGERSAQSGPAAGREREEGWEAIDAAVRGPAPPLPEETIFIRFDRNSNDFYSPDLEHLTDLVAGLLAHPEASLVITGYTDSRGSEAYNSRLSLFRANVVKSYLLGKGVPSRQMEVRGLGSQKPIGDNSTAEGRERNRRVEIKVISS